MITSYLAEGLAVQRSSSQAQQASQRCSRPVPHEPTHHRFPGIGGHHSQVSAAGSPAAP